MIKFVKLVEVYPAGVTTKTFTHEIINDDSVIEVYTEDANIYPIATTQSGNTVTISIVDHDEPVEVCVTINNMVSYSEPLYTSDILVPSPIEDYPLDVELFNIKGELQSIPFEYVGNEAFEALQTEVNGKAPQTEVSAIKESFAQLYADGYASRNLIQDISQGSWEDDGKKSTNQTSNVKRCLVENKIACVKGKSFTFSDEDNNYQIYARIFDASGTRVESIGWTNTATPTNNNSSYALVTIRKKDDSNFTPSDIKNAQIEYGTQATAFTEYAKPNTDLTQITEELKQSLSQLESNMNANNGDAWSSAKTYKKDEYCVYNNSVYKALVQNTNVLPTSVATWSKVSIGNELDYLNRNKVHCQKLSFNTDNTIVGTTNNQNYFLFGTTATTEGGFLYDFVWKQAINNANGYLKHLGTQTIISAEMSSTDFGVKLSAPSYVQVFVTSPYPFSLENRN